MTGRDRLHHGVDGLHRQAPTVNGHTLADDVRDARCWNPDVIRSLAMPIAAEGGLAMRLASPAQSPRARRGLRGP